MSNSQWHEDQSKGEQALRDLEKQAALKVLTVVEAKQLAFEIARRIADECHAGGWPTLWTVVNHEFALRGHK